MTSFSSTAAALLLLALQRNFCNVQAVLCEGTADDDCNTLGQGWCTSDGGMCVVDSKTDKCCIKRSKTDAVDGDSCESDLDPNECAGSIGITGIGGDDVDESELPLSIVLQTYNETSDDELVYARVIEPFAVNWSCDEGSIDPPLPPACSETFNLDLSTHDELRFAFTAPPGNEWSLSTSEGRDRIRFEFEAKAPCENVANNETLMQDIPGSNFTSFEVLGTDAADASATNFTYDPENSFVELSKYPGDSEQCTIFTRLQINGQFDNVLLSEVGWTAPYDPTKLWSGNQPYTYRTDGYMWIRANVTLVPTDDENDSTASPSKTPSEPPSSAPTSMPSDVPSASPSAVPSDVPSVSVAPSVASSVGPSGVPSDAPSGLPTSSPSSESNTSGTSPSRTNHRASVFVGIVCHVGLSLWSYGFFWNVCSREPR